MELPDKLYVAVNGTRIWSTGAAPSYLASDDPAHHEDGLEVGIYKLTHTRIISKKTTLKLPNNTTDNGDE